ncbi:histidinol dehydrogenase [Haematococcus lacustris]
MLFCDRRLASLHCSTSKPEAACILGHGSPVVCRLAVRLRQTRQVQMSAILNAVESLKLYRYEALSAPEIKALLQRPRIDFTAILNTVAPIVEKVRQEGDVAVREFTAKFDRVELSSVCVPIEELPEPTLPAEVTTAFDTAYHNIKAFHEAQRSSPLEVETMPGVVCRRVARPIGAVGLYVPGGTAVLPSSALMMAVPAAIAGCSTIVLATPPRPDGSITPEVLYCARKAGVTHILKAGGAQAVAAMAWGTASCPKVDKICGPGNQYVTAAKMLLQNSEAMVAIDMPAGPSEVLVVADAGANPAHVAADLLSQAEHGPDSQVVLLALPGADITAIEAELSRQCDALPRNATARKALSHSFAVQVASRDQAVDFANLYASEHLIINTEDAEAWVPLINNAGSLFLGRWTPESVGDYASGTNHVLPTYGYARMYSGVSLDTFQKKMTVQNLTFAGLQALGPAVAKMAEVEGLEAHRRAVTMRLAATS